MKEADIYAFFESYSKATRESDIDAMVLHYAEPYTGFVLGQSFHFPNRAAAKASAGAHVARLKEYGLSEVHVIDVQYHIISETSVIAFSIWEVRPKKGERWHMRLVYGLRESPAGIHAELAIADNEAINMLKRYPDFFPS
jgi:ketosteroid isomerase-like protein